MIRKRSSRKDLALGAYLIVDNKYESQYFKISDLQNELTSGKNIFKIKPILNSNINIDENNNIHYNY